jgi:hypothetical protein
MVMRALTVVAIFLAVGLAGCAANETDDTAIVGSTEGLELEAGKGAISGLLIDDRYRPIELTESPTSEYQRAGFILLQETGEQVQTDENGEFGFLDLEPGSYTLRAQVDGHEAKPQKVTVTEGVFEETDISARRLVINTGAVVTQHFAGFVDCSLFLVALSINPSCVPDTSGETNRFDVRPDYSNYEDATWLVTEILFNNEPQNGEMLEVVIRQLSNTDIDFSSAVIASGTYMKMHMEVNGTSPDEPLAGSESNPWLNDETLQIAIFGRGALSEEIRQGYEPVYETVTKDLPYPAYAPMRRGVGLELGIKANFLMSLFIGAPAVDPLEYCQLCAA